ncbi:MAG TPA: right-handed parallel beta-helix repeat-containing protein [Acidimicrobiales bacterium]
MTKLRRLPAALLASLAVAAGLGLMGAGPAWAPDCYRPDELGDTVFHPYQGSDASRVRQPYIPWRVLLAPCPFPADYRAVIVEPARVLLHEAGQVVRTVPLPLAEERRFEEVVAAVADPSWVGEVEPGVFVVDTAVVQRGSTMVVGEPAVKELRLTTRPHVFLGGLQSTVRFEGVTVTSWDTGAGGPDGNLDDGRPFVLYRDGSRLDAARSRFENLGSDRSEAYGVAWRSGATGTVVDSTFARNFFGAYLFEADAVEFRGNVFRDNVRYGLDPHDHTHNLVIEDNEAFGNGTHGFVFSDTVTASVLRNNRSHHNGHNGIVLHQDSSSNVVEGNLVEDNAHDGIVLIGSGDVRIAGNTVRGHEVGIRVNGAGSERILVEGNVLEGNGTGIQAYDGANAVTLRDNTHRGTTGVAVSLDMPEAAVHGERVEGGRTGIDLLSGAVRVEGTQISGVRDGIVARDAARAELAGGAIQALRFGVRAGSASVSVVGEPDVDAPRPYSWQERPQAGIAGRTELGYVGIAAVMVAVALHLLSWRRNRGLVSGPVPAHVRNSA